MLRLRQALVDRRTRLVAALLTPLVLAALLSQLRWLVAAPGAALVLVLVVVAAAATGDRVAGLLAALSSAAWFDFFLTRPYLTFTIADREDAEVAVLLVAVGLAVTELALWGRRRQRETSETEGLLDGVLATMDALGPRTPPDQAVARVASQIRQILGVDEVRYDPTPLDDSPALQVDGAVLDSGLVLDVERRGLPVHDVVQIRVGAEEYQHGRYLVTSSTSVIRPTRRQLQVAVGLAQEVGLLLELDSPSSQ